ncbi:tail fiber assembly protein [Enterobacter hormaechei]|uniref:tail fiber assembly protein n=1 Tax=Enterobacter hormaechei TaxID=158836 RepID=UPI0007359171|nr:tail fiber assembly protein [Enterobacter hormaechei]HAS1749991.1 hypothetical protein [Enterobacter hormaechei subsp. oharae]KTG93683.1 hypothetical protein ASV34_16155 [Enterobacter hormaechei subsp. xiangfangensis]KTG98734.1 hypothetical protein ASV33_16115 [Enterobacter hormaechei subsp. xiangfangensis]KTH98092.1 hypothetical protein ASV12_05540 [Enterobacter hormaechei subsp. xiangfangensis]KTI87859.1 hypothetical protein ASU94_14770 [Enterobacter hormaechei subsp. xiangfangensis]
MFYFSNTTRCFYCDENNISRPEDAIEVSEQDVHKYSGQNPQWMLPNVSEGGKMEWIDDISIDKRTARYEINKQEKERLLNRTIKERYTLEVIGQTSVLSVEQSTMMQSLSAYINELNQVDLYADNPVWPIHP